MPQVVSGSIITNANQVADGVITNAHVNGAAAIVDTKLATISTAGKVSGAALTLLANIPSAAGLIPAANLSPVYPLMRIATIFETAGRSDNAIAGTGNPALTFNTTGATINISGNNADNRGSIAMQILSDVVAPGLYLGSPAVGFSFFLQTIGSDIEVFYGIGDYNMRTFVGNLIVFTTRHIGFKVIRTASGAINLFGTMADGTTESATAILTTIAAGDQMNVMFKVNGTTSVDFYWSKNGGAWSAATRITATIPSNDTDQTRLLFLADVGNVANINRTWVQAAFYEK